MKTISVKASRSYHVHIGEGLMQNLPAYIKELSSTSKVAIISDSNVWPLFGEQLKDKLNQAGYWVSYFTFPAGEASKNGNTYLEILNFLADSQITRSDLLIALGGGVVGDIAGFAAATYLRGIPFVQIPTTLLAMVDSSVGGKTAIDLPAGKNLAGAFCQPSLVLCDLDTLSTLPEAIFRDGCAEVIKYGALYDPELFNHLNAYGLAFDREAVVARCVALKAAVVAQDEYDTGERQKLNFGHTIGHGIEAHSNFTISHGKAVAIGMAMIAKASATEGQCAMDVYEQLCAILVKFGLPHACDFTAEQLYTSALSDKKRAGGIVNLIVPNKIGNCKIHPMPVTKLQTFIEAGL